MFVVECLIMTNSIIVCTRAKLQIKYQQHENKQEQSVLVRYLAFRAGGCSVSLLEHSIIIIE